MTLIPLLTLSVLLPDLLDVNQSTGPYNDIQMAVSAASDGDVVRAAPGT